MTIPNMKMTPNILDIPKTTNLRYCHLLYLEYLVLTQPVHRDPPPWLARLHLLHLAGGDGGDAVPQHRGGAARHVPHHQEVTVPGKTVDCGS